MGLTIPVIVNTVNNLSDARYAAGMGVDWMGFQVDEEAERFVKPDLFKAITSWLSGIKTVAEVSILSPETLTYIQEHYQPDYIQFEQFQDIDQTILKGLPCFQKIVVPPGQEIGFLQSFQNDAIFTTYVEVDFSQWTDWKLYKDEIKKINHPALFWALPIEKEDISILFDLNIHGIALKGGDEQRPGWKDLDEMIDILEALEEN